VIASKKVSLAVDKFIHLGKAMTSRPTLIYFGTFDDLNDAIERASFGSDQFRDFRLAGVENGCFIYLTRTAHNKMKYATTRSLLSK
jgi:hypothetical protein